MKHIHLSLATMPIRSRGLFLISIVWFIVGIGTYGTQTPVDSAFHQEIPESLGVAMWWAASLGALGAALDKQDGKRDWLALAACVIPPMLRITSYLWSWIVWLIPGGPPGFDRGWYSASLFAVLVAFVWFVAQIPDDIRAPTNPFVDPSEKDHPTTDDGDGRE